MTDYTERAREWLENCEFPDWYDDDITSLAALLASVAEEQRERDAVVCLEHTWARDALWWMNSTKKGISAEAGRECAAAIRRQP